jgi:monoamine oxidase
MRRSSHSSLTRMLREAQAACTESDATGMPMDEVTASRGERARRQDFTRRQFLQSTGTLLAAAAASRVLRPIVAHAASQPRIVIVGAGLAGIRCAHKLWVDRGLTSTIYEWDTHAGGRVETLRNYFDNGQIVEQHGEFISSEHASMRALARRYGLAFDLAQKYPPNLEDSFWFKGSYYTQSELNKDWQKFAWKLFNKSVKAAPFPTLYNHHNRPAYQWDHMSVVDWINKYVPGGLQSSFGSLCYQDVLGEYGGPPEQQSALNLIYLLGYDDSVGGNNYQPKNSPVLGGTDERYHIRGGTDQVINGMIGELPTGTLQFDRQLVALKLNSDGSYTCSFQSGSSLTEVIADRVVLAIPFTTLRNVDLSRAGLSALKTTAIRNLQLGSNAKIMLQFSSRIWRKNKFTGTTLGDNGTFQGWECTNYQPGPTGILINFPAGTAGANLGTKYGLTTDQGPAPAAMVNDTLALLEPILPGVTAAYNGLAYCNVGAIDPHLMGAWSQYNIGQYTGFAGIESVQEGNIHFAGEQTSVDFQGFMEGAVTSGERVAGEI